MKYTNEFLLEELKRINNEHGAVTKSLIKAHAPFDYYTIQRRFGSIEQALILADIPIVSGQRKMISKDRVVTDLYRMYDEFGYVSKPLYEKHGLYNQKVVRRIFGSFSNMYEELNIKRHPSGYQPTDEELIADIHRLIKEYGNVNSTTIRLHGKFSVFVYQYRFGSMNDMYRALEIPTKYYSASKEELIADAKRIYKENGVLTKDIIDECSEYSVSQYYRRFGDINKLYDILGLPNRYPGDECFNSANYCIRKFEKYLGEESDREVRFDWLRNPTTNRILPVDAYFPKNKLIVEYNGPQHYQLDQKYSTTQEKLEYRQNLDRVKYELIRNHGFKLAVVHFKDIVDDEYISKIIRG